MCNLDDCDEDYLTMYHGRPVAAWPHKCDDCGRTIPVGERYEVVVWSEWRDAETVDEELALPAGDPRRIAAEATRGPRARPFTGDNHTTVEWVPGTRYTATACLHCLTAGRWVQEVCGGYMYATACWQLAEHWDEDTLYRCRDLARLVLYSGARFDLINDGWNRGPSAQSCYHDAGPIVARSRRAPWTDRAGRLIPLATIDTWVTGALDAYHRHDAQEITAA